MNYLLYVTHYGHNIKIDYNELHMPAKSPPNTAKLEKLLHQLGSQIHQRRKDLKVSAIATSESAGVSRMTLNRIERGEPSVTLGAYLNVISVLGLSLTLIENVLIKSSSSRKSNESKIPKKIRIADYPQLKRLAWQLKGTKELTPAEVLDLYERNWRHVDLNKMTEKERQFIEALTAYLGRGKLLV